MVSMQQLFFLSVQIISKQDFRTETCPPFTRWAQKDASTTFFRMFCASVVCKLNILHEQYHSADRFVGNPSMFDIHVIICCALRVDSTCCCLALHTIWNLFTCFRVTLSPLPATVEPQAVSLCYIFPYGTVGGWRQTLKVPERISEAYLFKIRCVYS